MVVESLLTSFFIPVASCSIFGLV